MITKYLLTLGIGHLLGDFYFQSEKLAKHKDAKYTGVLLHSLEYYFVVLLVMLPLFSMDMFIAATFLSLTHFVIDTVKFILLKKKKIRKNSKAFVVDQCAHIICILVLAYIMDYYNFTAGYLKIVSDVINVFGLNAEVTVRWIMAVLIIHAPVNIFIQNFLSDYKPKNDETLIMVDNRAGRRIGTLERVIMLIFLSLNQYVAMGFVLTAKSIARYDKISKDEKFAEYYLLGTLLSALCVIVCKMAVLGITI